MASFSFAALLNQPPPLIRVGFFHFRGRSSSRVVCFSRRFTVPLHSAVHDSGGGKRGCRMVRWSSSVAAEAAVDGLVEYVDSL